MSVKLLFVALIITSSNAFCKTYSAFVGVGGEPEGKSTMFDKDVDEMGTLSQTLGGETVIALNGGHANTEKIIKKQFKETNQSFTAPNFEKIIADYEKRIKNGEIKSGDQLMIMINTHGAEKLSSEELTHQVALAGNAIQDLNTGEGADIFSLDRLKTLSALAQSKNIKLAIIDFSCHSGNTLPLANANTCVISSSGPNHYGYGGASLTFSRRMLKHMKKGKNLEEVFLSARNASWDLSFPMISTPTGLSINEELYDPITPYLYSHGFGDGKFEPYIRREAEKGEACEASQELESLKELIHKAEQYQSIAKDARFTGKEAQDLKNALDEYYNLQKKLRDELNAFDTPKMDQKESFCTDYEQESLTFDSKTYKLKTVIKKEKNCSEYTVKEILRSDFSWALSFYEKMASEKNSFNSFYKSEVENTKKVMARKEEIIKQHPDLNKIETFFANQKLLGIRTNALAAKVSYASQHLYDALYKQRSEGNKDSNPCKDFVL